jgi:hypothetical protein
VGRLPVQSKSVPRTKAREAGSARAPSRDGPGTQHPSVTLAARAARRYRGTHSYQRRPDLSAMLHHTFIHADGVGPTTERKLWRSGVHTWDVFMDLCRKDKIPLPRLHRLAPLIQDSQLALGRQDVKFFSRRLPSAEQWLQRSVKRPRLRPSGSVLPARSPARVSPKCCSYPSRPRIGGDDVCRMDSATRRWVRFRSAPRNPSPSGRPEPSSQLGSPASVVIPS